LALKFAIFVHAWTWATPLRVGLAVQLGLAVVP